MEPPLAFNNEITQAIAEFVRKIGLPVRAARLDHPTFLPGIEVESGAILIDESRLTYPGDILHEAGHLAVAPATLRPTLSGEVDLPGFNADVVEAFAIGWSYAAIVSLGLDPGIVFHRDGYKGQAEALRNNYELGIYIGANGLVDMGLTRVGTNAAADGVAPYPHMIKWLRD
ncbi:MAG: hypothetical protein ABIP75_12835 [Pyrinomonadaceae bacterium]